MIHDVLNLTVDHHHKILPQWDLLISVDMPREEDRPNPLSEIRVDVEIFPSRYSEDRWIPLGGGQPAITRFIPDLSKIDEALGSAYHEAIVKALLKRRHYRSINPKKTSVLLDLLNEYRKLRPKSGDMLGDLGLYDFVMGSADQLSRELIMAMASPKFRGFRFYTGMIIGSDEPYNNMYRVIID